MGERGGELMKVTICWCFNEHGLETLAVEMPDGDTFFASMTSMAGHPGEIQIAEVDLDDGSETAANLRDWLSFAREPHDCLPSPICEVCGAEAGSVEQAMKNAVMRGGLGDADPDREEN